MQMANLSVAFEGLSHPYKANIVKVGGVSSIRDMPEVQQAFNDAKGKEAS